MPTNPVVTISADALSPDFCHENWPATAAALAALLHGTLPGTFGGINYGNSVPAPADQDKPWIRTNASGTLDGVYVYAGGYWARPHAVEPSSYLRHLWMGTEPQLKLLDGGVDVAVTDYTGPFWAIDSVWAAKSPMGVGTLPAGTIISLSTEFGEDKHTMTQAELVTHKHDPPTGQAVQAVLKTGNGVGINAVGQPNTDPVVSNWTADVGSSTPFNTVHPIRGVYFIKRTARIYITV